MKKFIRQIGLLSFIVFAACAIAVTSCGSDDDDDPIDPPTVPDTGGSDEDEDDNGVVNVNLVGKRYEYQEVVNTHENHQNTMYLVLTFNTSSTFTITKDCWYWKYQQGAYRHYYEKGTKRGTYKRVGNMIYFDNYNPFNYGPSSEAWREDDEWDLTILDQYFLSRWGTGGTDVFIIVQ